MARKRSELSLYKRYRRKNTTKKTPSSETILTPEKVASVKKIRLATPRNTPRSTPRNTPSKRIITPLSNITKRVRTQSPIVTFTISSDDGDWETLLDDESNDSEDFAVFSKFRSIMKSSHLWKLIMLFMNLVVAGRFPLDNISLLLFLETVKFFGCETTTQMTYFPETKRFWKTGGFYMRIARSSGVYPTHESDTVDDRDDKTEPMSTSSRSTNAIVTRNHAFDEPERAKARRKIQFGFVSDPSAPSRGALPVRQYHRKDESKIIPTKRLGIDYQ